MQASKQQLTTRTAVALGTSVILSGILFGAAAPAMATPSALSRAAEKRAAVAAAQSAAIPEPEKQQTKNEALSRNEALSFDPFAPSATPAAEPAAAASAAAPQVNNRNGQV